MNRETDSTNSSETAISVLIPLQIRLYSNTKATSDVLLFNIFEVEPPTSRSERSERVGRGGNRHGTTQLPHCDQPTLKSISTVGYFSLNMDVRRTAVVKLTVSTSNATHSTEPPSNTCTARTEPLITVGPTPLTPSVRPTSERCVTRSNPQTSRGDRPTGPACLLAIKRAVEAVKACVERWKMDSASLNRRSPPKRWTIYTRSATFYRNKVSLATVEDESNRRSFFPGRQSDALRAVRTLRTTSSARVRFGTTRPTDEFHRSTFRCGGQTVTMMSFGRYRAPRSNGPRYRPQRQ